MDISIEKDTLEMANSAMKEFGRIDILVNNAATGLVKKIFFEVSAEEWDRVMATNVKGSWQCIKAVFPHMKKQGKGKIVNISSTVADAGLDLLMPYSSCKGGVNAATRAMASALGEHNINVNCVAPGYVLTSASLEMSSHTEKGDKFQASLRTLKRDAHEDDLVGGVLFFASDDSDFITGQIMAVDGGGVFR